MAVRIEKPKFNLRDKLSELDFSVLPYDRIPEGTAIQYVQASHTRMTNRFSTSSTSYQATNYDLTITPRSINNRILIYANLSSHANNNQYIYVRVYNVTAGRYVNHDGGVTNDGMYESALGGKSQWAMLPVEAVDIPGSTLPQTYRLYIRSSGNGGTAYSGWSSSAPNSNNMNFMSATEYKQ
tara:strand:+ start:228 stop:773 length:546 start_codon:yes stop_codon:yes gene_type:complete